MRRFGCVLVLLLMPFAIYGQTAPAKVTAQQSFLWLQAFSSVKFKNGWSVPLEAQLRRADTGLTWQALLARAALVREVNKHVAVGGGFGIQVTWPYGAFPAATRFHENRTFEQVVVKWEARSTGFENRLRLEQRWVEKVDPIARKVLDAHTYTNRLRYKSGVTIPLRRVDPSKSGLGDGDTFLFVNDEIAFNFGKNVQKNTFDQNRFAVGIGHHFSKLIFQGGYLHQYIQRSDGVRFESNHAITLSLTYNIPVH